MQSILHLSPLIEADGVPVLVNLEGSSSQDSSTIPSRTPPALRDIQAVRKILMSLEINLPPSLVHI